MHYFFVSRQFTHDSSFYFAKFSTLQFAEELIGLKIKNDQEDNKEIIYRVYQDGQVIVEHNKWRVHATGPVNAETDFPYKIFQLNNNKITNIAELTSPTDAKDFINERLQADAKSKLNITYRLYHGQQYLHEYNQSKQLSLPFEKNKKENVVFYPSPLRTTPALGPKNFIIKNDEEDEDTDKDK